MRLNVRLSAMTAMTAMLCALVTLLMLAGSALSYFRLHQQRLDRQLTAMADSFNRLMLTEPLPRYPDYRLVIFYTDQLASDVHSLRTTAPVSVALGLILVFLFLALRRQIQPQESLETRARRIILRRARECWRAAG